jgi:hypothetical protein
MGFVGVRVLAQPAQVLIATSDLLHSDSFFRMVETYIQSVARPLLAGWLPLWITYEQLHGTPGIAHARLS